jgi:NAD(P)-dependent dehydrogenase (short-subunit alcohol dehydrogenase family)
MNYKDGKALDSSHKTLIFGSTGSTGKHILRCALQRNDQVYVYVRSPEKLDVDIKDQVHIIQGDLFDTTAVADTVKQVKPNSIIVASAHLYKSKYSPLNTAAVPAMVKALQETNLIKTCRLVFLSGLFPAPRDEPLSLMMRVVRFVLATYVGNWAAVEDNTNTTNYLLYETNETGLQFTIVRMGLVVEEPSKGSIVPVDYLPSKSVTFGDMGLFLVKLAHGEYSDETNRRAIKSFYPR